MVAVESPNSSESDNDDDQPVKNFGRYELIRLLGRGTMGRVYLAIDPQLRRKVALKIPETKGYAGIDWREVFYQEAQSMAQIRHTNLCPVYEVAELDGVVYLTMGFIEGPSLEDLIKKHERFSLKQTALLVGKLALALEKMHGVGVIHRDLKPSNIIIDPSGEPVVVDFGLAHSRWTNLTDDLIVGTPGYIAPEVVTSNGQEIGPASDIYSLGAIAYMMLTGRLPFTGTHKEIYRQQMRKTPVPIDQIRSDIDHEVSEALLRTLQRNPKDRYASALELADSMKQLLRKIAAAKPKYERFQVQLIDGSHVVHIRDDSMLSTDAVEQLKKELFDFVADAKPVHLILNVAAVQRCSSQAISVLLYLGADLAQMKTTMHLCGVRESIQEVFEVLGLDKEVFKVYDSVSAAIRAKQMT
ncbi:MAG: protein kinase [Pirellulaceae bacterium]|nr:protein kinase [Pirellulaceae bacterium]